MALLPAGLPEDRLDPGLLGGDGGPLGLALEERRTRDQTPTPCIWFLIIYKNKHATGIKTRSNNVVRKG